MRCLIPPGDALRIKHFELFADAFAFAQDGDPSEPGLHAVQVVVFPKVRAQSYSGTPHS